MIDLDTLTTFAATVEDGGWDYSADLIRKVVAELRARRAVMQAVAQTLRDAGFVAVAATLEEAYVEAAIDHS